MTRKPIIHWSGPLAALSLSLSSAWGAESPAESDANLDEELKFLHAESLVITASRVLEPQARSISSTTVVTQEQIRAMNAKNLQDVLYTLPGINTTQSSFGAKEIAIRGIKNPFSQKVLILLNGHPLDHNLTNGGSTDIYDNIGLDNVKRIEIVRGPGSALYGANAFLGTINIMTKDVNDQEGVELTASGGSFGTQQYNIYTGKRFDDLKVTANANIYATDGINTKFTNTDTRSNLTEQRYDIHTNVSYRDWSFEGHAANKETGTFAGFNDSLLTGSRRDYQDYYMIVGYNHQFTDKVNLEVKAYHDSFAFDNLIQVLPDLYLRTGIANTKSGGEVLVDYQLFDTNKLIVGAKAEYQEQFDVTHSGGPSPGQQTEVFPKYARDKNRTLTSAYIEDIWDIVPSFRLSAGARYDRYSDFGNTFNPRAGFNWEFLKGYTLKFSYGTAFRAPTFGETGGSSQFLLGSQVLQPELIKTYETGISAQPFAGLTAGFALFHSRIDQIIELLPVPGSPQNFAYVNAGGVASQGVEVEAKYTYMEGSYVALNYTLQDNISQETQRPLADIPRHLGNIMVNQQLMPHLSFFANAFVKGEMPRGSLDQRTPLGGYTIVNIALRSKDLWKGLELSASINNLFDHHGKDPSSIINGDLPIPARSAFIRASYAF